MADKYLKDSVVNAEQFDGSDAMVDKYELIDAGTMLGTHHSSELYLYGSGKVDVGDWITTDAFGRYELISDNKFRRQHIKLPVISKEVADWIELGKSKGIPLDTALMIIMAGRTESPDISGVTRWIWHYHMADIAIAWAIGYTVEE
ncbi:orf151 [Lactobacillus phage LP65]|uniref:Orf151 n=1 Tax=Lactobacillus phage LP65 TaxID=2892344 RepID=Q5ULG3_9CAUD|nr:hypothetical protein LP65_gp151 [Lactobacillus phage LP65]AAV35971.1 orf151 [Lactobacillus phage LP65]